MLEPVLEEQPKWLLLREVVEEVQAQRGAIASLAPAAPAADGPAGGGGAAAAGGVQVSCHCLAAHVCKPYLPDLLRAGPGAGTRHTCITPADPMCMHYLHA